MVAFLLLLIQADDTTLKKSLIWTDAVGDASFFLLFVSGLLLIFTCGFLFPSLDFSSFCLSKFYVGPLLLSIYLLSLGEISFSLVVSVITTHMLMSPTYLHLFPPSYFVLSVCNPFSMFLFFCFRNLICPALNSIFFIFTHSNLIHSVMIVHVGLKLVTHLLVFTKS